MYIYLLEELSVAIGARLLIRFSYSNEVHEVEPYLLGQNKMNQDCLCAWKKHSSTAGSTQPGWCSYILSEIQNLELLEHRFSSKRPGYDPYDSTMNRIYYRL